MTIRVTIIVFSLHFYHVIGYFKKLRFDYWLHNILSVGLDLPLTLFSVVSSLLGHRLFYLTRCLDYFLLFLNRNGYI